MAASRPLYTYRSDMVSELLTALSAFQSAIDNVAKDASNPFFKSKYATLAACLDMIRPHLKENGLSYQQTVSTGQDGSICVTSVLGHKSGQWWSSDLCMPAPTGGQSHAQQVGSLITYMRRYMLTAQLGIAQEDDDANSAPAAPAPKPKAVPLLTEDQTQELYPLLLDAKVDEEKICKQYGISSLAMLPQSKFMEVRNRLLATIDKNKGNSDAPE